MKTFEDDFGNKIQVSDQGVLTLFLPAKKARRNIGKIFAISKTFSVCRWKAKHLLRKANAFGFNHYVLSHAKTFDKVFIMGDTNYMVPLDVILKEGFYLHFKQDGFERQIFMKLEQLEQYKTKSRL
jgi:hypothetical protein